MKALLLLLALTAAAGAEPLADALAKLQEKGYSPAARLSGTYGKVPFTALIARQADGSRDRLYIYAVARGRAFPIFVDPNPDAGRLEFDPTQKGGRLGDFLHDGARSLAYRVESPSSSGKRLRVLRAEGIRWKVVADYQDGKVMDLDGDGKPEFSARSRPLGRLFSVECGRYGTMAPDAFQTDLFSWKGGRFVSVARRFPGFFRERLRRDEEALAALERARGDKPGSYLAGAITVFFDRDALGERQQGWAALSKALDPPAVSPPGSAACADKIRTELRARLSIPSDW